MHNATRRTILLAAAICGPLLLVLAGCSAKPFGITARRLVGTVDRRGQPGPEKTEFRTGDPAVYLWLKYQGASPGSTALTVRMTHKGADESETSRELQRDLSKPDGTLVCSLTPPQGEALAPGEYTVEALGPNETALGPKMAFSVASGPEEGAPAEAP